MSSIFLNYRRADSPDSVARIYGKLVAHLRNREIFYDHESIEYGDEFPELLHDKVTTAGVVLVVIGPKWVEELNKRKSAPVDFVRSEIQVALASGGEVIPILVGHAAMPTDAELVDYPELLPLLRKNAKQIPPDPLFDVECHKLITHLERTGPVEIIGTILIGKYKVQRQIGEGGMGNVYVAEQTNPVKRLVAIKLIKPGMDTKDVLARFDAERQALAVMDHPNVCKVLDAGTASNGRPFFVMEYVKGVPITQFCDDRKLTPRERLELFMTVCKGVQHAHQKGIIHRDIKPANVLVEMIDGKPVPKVIDFGIAKATQKLTDKTFAGTEFGKWVGTLEYSSPEQAEGRFDINTLTDVYSLGILLYELLVGSPPFTRAELMKASEEEMRRVIKEEKPSKPSKRLSSSKNIPTIAANRQLDPAKLTKLLTGELDSIVMKSLAKAPDGRYATPTALADDINRHLTGQPIAARKPSFWRSLSKSLVQHRTAVIAGCLMFVVLATVLVASFWQADRDNLNQVDIEHLGTYAKKQEPEQVHEVAKDSLSGTAPEQKPFQSVNGDTESPILPNIDHGVKPKMVPKVLPEISKSDPKPGEERSIDIGGGIKMVFCWIPPGKAMLGDPKEENNPEHEYVEKTGFWMAKYLVTQEQWAHVMTNHVTLSKHPSYFIPSEETMKKDGITDTSRFPIERVSWKDCREFLRNLNSLVSNGGGLGKQFALPNEDQWEYAYRGGKGNKLAYYWGNNLVNEANVDGKKGRTTEVGEYEKVAPHPWGLCDMSGNLRQWCDDWYDATNCVLRGGSWSNTPEYARASYRYFYRPDRSFINVGFRVVLLPFGTAPEQKPFQSVNGDTESPILPKVGNGVIPKMTPKIEPKNGETVTVDLGGGEKMELVRVPQGENMLGSSEEDLKQVKELFRETPDNEEYKKFKLNYELLMGKTHVTVGQFKRFIAETKHETDGEKNESSGWNATKKDWEKDKKYSWRNPGFTQGDDHPVVCVSWNDAKAFCEWLEGKVQKQLGTKYKVRLPTEEEWEYACRAGSRSLWYFGNDPEDLARHANVADTSFRQATGKDWGIKADDDFDFTMPVGKKGLNKWGFADMHGNAWQWCENLLSDKSANRVLRGGSWYVYTDCTRAAYRNDGAPVNSGNYYGFRVAVLPLGVATEQKLFPSLNSDTDSPILPNPGNGVIHESVPKMELKIEPKVLPEIGKGEPKPGEERSIDLGGGVKMVFCWIPPGKATLGDPKESNNPEHEHEEKTGFWMAKYHVTQEQWVQVMKNHPKLNKNPSYFIPSQAQVKKDAIMDTSRFPVDSVSWTDCQEFLNQLNGLVKYGGGLGKQFALPHEDQWEYAYRGGKGNKQPYYWGDELNNEANVNFQKKRTTEVGEYEQVSPHPWGICDMSGNLCQWCENQHSVKSINRVLRGGSWSSFTFGAWAGFRSSYSPDGSKDYIGFRVVVLP